jgi:hypothetical protein
LFSTPFPGILRSPTCHCLFASPLSAFRRSNVTSFSNWDVGMSHEAEAEVEAYFRLLTGWIDARSLPSFLA